MTKILAVADVEDDVLCSLLANREIGPFDAVVSCGDLQPDYLDYVVTTANAPLYYVRGNHDTDESGYEEMWGEALDGRVAKVGGLRIAGLDGSRDYRSGIVGFSEREMRVKAMRLAMLATLTGGLDVLVTHAAPQGFGDLDDDAHQGFKSFNWLLSYLHPQVLVHGHVHEAYGMVTREMTHPSGARVINASGYQVLEL